MKRKNKSKLYDHTTEYRGKEWKCNIYKTIGKIEGIKDDIKISWLRASSDKRCCLRSVANGLKKLDSIVI